MRWPINPTTPLGPNGEEDFMESDSNTWSNTFLHYIDGTGKHQISHYYGGFDWTQWHTIQATQLNNQVTVSIDGVVAFTYQGNATTVPNVARSVVLQQECSHRFGCPTGTTGREDIQVDWITVDNAF